MVLPTQRHLENKEKNGSFFNVQAPPPPSGAGSFQVASHDVRNVSPWANVKIKTKIYGIFTENLMKKYLLNDSSTIKNVQCGGGGKSRKWSPEFKKMLHILT